MRHGRSPTTHEPTGHQPMGSRTPAERTQAITAFGQSRPHKVESLGEGNPIRGGEAKGIRHCRPSSETSVIGGNGGLFLLVVSSNPNPVNYLSFLFGFSVGSGHSSEAWEFRRFRFARYANALLECTTPYWTSIG